ncbi:hypothetical protein ACFU99_23325 [Streptomyces sp. NPDC057654]|uniref:hypothetical protein n=1 Tax=Streptomyces sp. NPDC057654 TaxID=3346196 RepID=UPI003680945D
MGRIFDALDSAVAATVGNAAAQREANKWARNVRVGDTWYSVETHKQPEGEVQLVHAHHFTKKDKFTGQAMCGHEVAASVYLAHSPMHKKPPYGLPTIEEYVADGSWNLPGAADEVANSLRVELKKLLRTSNR